MEAKIYNKSWWISETNEIYLKNLFFKSLSKAGFKIMKFIEHSFEPQGYTALWLLGESHLAIHTFPEEQQSYIELSSCNKSMYDTFLYNFKKNIGHLIVAKK